MLTVEYSYYTGVYHGKLPEEEFERLEAYASAYLDDLTMGRISDELAADVLEKCRYALCAVVDARQRNEQREGIASETNDGISRSYVVSSSGSGGGAGAANVESRRLYEAAALFLAQTGLLYRGVG